MLQGTVHDGFGKLLNVALRWGYSHLRPVWMMNPEMVSRLFPLQPGLFDLVVFDEASQLPVECALPALFRARRAIVSGDEADAPVALLQLSA